MNNPKLIWLNKQISRLESKLNRLKEEKQAIVEGRNCERRFKKKERKERRMREVIQALDGIEYIDEFELALSRRYR